MLEKVNETKLSYKAFQSENTNKSWLVLLHLVRYQGRVGTQSLRVQQGCHHASMPVQTLVDAKRARFKNQNQHLCLALSSTPPSHSVTFTHLIWWLKIYTVHFNCSPNLVRLRFPGAKQPSEFCKHLNRAEEEGLPYSKNQVAILFLCEKNSY